MALRPGVPGRDRPWVARSHRRARVPGEEARAEEEAAEEGCWAARARSARCPGPAPRPAGPGRRARSSRALPPQRPVRRSWPPPGGGSKAGVEVHWWEGHAPPRPELEPPAGGRRRGPGRPARRPGGRRPGRPPVPPAARGRWLGSPARAPSPARRLLGGRRRSSLAAPGRGWRHWPRCLPGRDQAAGPPSRPRPPRRGRPVPRPAPAARGQEPRARRAAPPGRRSRRPPPRRGAPRPPRGRQRRRSGGRRPGRTLAGAAAGARRRGQLQPRRGPALPPRDVVIPLHAVVHTSDRPERSGCSRRRGGSVRPGRAPLPAAPGPRGRPGSCCPARRRRRGGRPR